MRATTELFTINGEPMLVPDAEVSMSYEDLDSADSGRDESGVMHRIVTRYKVASWGFQYSGLNEEEKYGITWQNAMTGLWSGYNFNIIEC